LIAVKSRISGKEAVYVARETTFAERCLACGGREYGYDPLLPYGVEPTGHAWLHSRCWEAWHAARKREAAAALKAMGVGKPTATE
jgi:hypothetical protein